MKCIVEEHNNGHRKYFPIELLDVIIECDSTIKDWDTHDKDDESGLLQRERHISGSKKVYDYIR